MLRDDGHVDVIKKKRMIRNIEPLGARAIALRGEKVDVMTRDGTLDVYALWNGEMIQRWRAHDGATAALDVHYGVDVLTAGKRLYAIRLANGKRRVLLTAPKAVRAKLDDIGVVYT